MVEVMENRFIFRDKEDSVYCYNCRTKMAFNGYSYECHRCGSVYEKNISEV